MPPALMPPARADVPVPGLSTRSDRWVRGFNVYNSWYLRRHFSALNILPSAPDTLVPGAEPATVFYCNHPGWWDPLVMLWLSGHFYPGLRAYGPMAAPQLERYGFFKRLGLFGVRDGVGGAVDFLEVAPQVLALPGGALWLNAQGHFADPRARPVHLQAGLAHLAQRVLDIRYVAVALEYPMLHERQPAIHAALTEVRIPDGFGKRERLALLEKGLEALQGRLADATIRLMGSPVGTPVAQAGLRTIWQGSRGSSHGMAAAAAPKVAHGD